MPNTAAYLDFILEQLAPLGKITSRAMFGGHCLYCDDAVFALLANNALYLKVDDVTRPKFTQRNLQPFHPFDQEDFAMSYYQAPPEMLDNTDAMHEWGGVAVEAGRRAKRPKSRAGGASSKRGAGR